MSATAEAHRALYAKIAVFKCIDGCTACCGPVPFTRWEWEHLADKRQTSGLDCAYSPSGKCDIYEDRPFMCRLFGTAREGLLACPFGKSPIVPLSPEAASSLFTEYKQLGVARVEAYKP